MWLKKLASIPLPTIKELFVLTKQITGLPFTNKRITDFGYRTKTPDKHYEFAISGDILVVSAWAGPIPNFDRLVAEIKKRFGDVHTNEGTYINARRFGLPELEPTVSEPILLSPLPQITVPEKLNTQNATEMFHMINAALENRKVSTQGKPKIKTLGTSGDFYKVLEIMGKMYVYDSTTLYAVTNMADAQQLIKLSKITLSLSRALEVADWKNQDFSKPY